MISRYSGAINLLYAERTFEFRHLDGILGFSCSVLPQRLNSVTSLHLDGAFYERKRTNWQYGLQCVSDHHKKRFKVSDSHLTQGNGTWEATCQVLAGMQGLKRLHIEITGMSFLSLYYRQNCSVQEERIFGPLRGIIQCETFVVEVHWNETESFEKEKAPFRLNRTFEEHRARCKAC